MLSSPRPTGEIRRAPGRCRANRHTATDLARAWRVAERLEYGIVGVNDPTPGAPHVPFGGVKQSGIGKEGGALGFDEFLDTKLISIGET